MEINAVIAITFLIGFICGYAVCYYFCQRLIKKINKKHKEELLSKVPPEIAMTKEIGDAGEIFDKTMKS